MNKFNKFSNKYLKYTEIKSADKSHIKIINKNDCLNKCEKKPCTYYCPTEVFRWHDDEIQILYQRCIECGACPTGCPFNNIDWSFPPGGYGVNYKY